MSFAVELFFIQKLSELTNPPFPIPQLCRRIVCFHYRGREGTLARLFLYGQTHRQVDRRRRMAISRALVPMTEIDRLIDTKKR